MPSAQNRLQKLIQKLNVPLPWPKGPMDGTTNWLKTQVALHERIIAIRQQSCLINSAVIIHQDDRCEYIKGGVYSLHILTCINNTLVAHYVKLKRKIASQKSLHYGAGTAAIYCIVPPQLNLPPLHYILQCQLLRPWPCLVHEGKKFATLYYFRLFVITIIQLWTN